MRRPLFLVLLLALAGCAGPTPVEPGAPVERVPEGKADDFYSDVAAEFEVRGELTVEAAADASAAERREAAQRRVDAAVLYLTTFVTKKIDGFFTNLEYGGHAAMVRNRTSETLELIGGAPESDDALRLRAANELGFEELDAVLDRRAAEGLVAGRPFETIEEVDAVRYVGPVALDQLLELGQAAFGAEGGELRVRFAVQLAGPRNLPALLGREFDLRMPAGATSDGEGSLSTVRSFDPDTYTGELEAVPCTLESVPEARNSFPAYAAFFEDGVFDITVFQGHEYNEFRADLWEAMIAYHLLVFQNGFRADELDLLDAPDAFVQSQLNEALGEQAAELSDLVDQVARLHPDSGPLVGSIVADGAPVRVEVRIFHSEMFREDRAGQRQRALDEIAGRDVFFYNGHAGPWYGFYLDAAGAAEVREDDFATAAFTDRQQLFVANGCQTYSQYADMVYAHPAKDESNLDVITTVNFSYGEGSDMLLGALVQTDGAGNHVAWSYGDLIRAFNEIQINEEKQVFYGVTGIDGNARLHPYAALDRVGDACSWATECGDPNGNVCAGTCGAVALDAAACPEGTVYSRFANGDNVIQGGACFAR